MLLLVTADEMKVKNSVQFTEMVLNSTKYLPIAKSASKQRNLILARFSRSNLFLYDTLLNPGGFIPILSKSCFSQLSEMYSIYGQTLIVFS